MATELTSPLHSVENLAANVRRTTDYTGLSDQAREGFDTTVAQSAGIVQRMHAQLAAVQENRDASDEKKSRDVGEVLARMHTEFAKVEGVHATDRAAYEAAVERIASGQMVPTPDGRHVLRESKPPAGDELRIVQEIRGAKRAVPQGEVESQYLRAVQDGSDAEFVRAIETAPRSAPLVREYVREQARQIRLATSPAADGLAEQRKALELREMMLGRTRRAVESRRRRRRMRAITARRIRR